MKKSEKYTFVEVKVKSSVIMSCAKNVFILLRHALEI